MALFDAIISGAAEKFGLGDKAGALLSSVLGLMTNQETGGFGGFIGKFKDAGLGDTAASWITGGDRAEISDDQVTSALGSDTIGDIAEQAGIPADKATSAIGFMLPQVVDKLTPDGEMPDDESLLSKIGGFITGTGGTAAGAVAGAAGVAGAVASGAADKASDAAGAVGDAAGDAVDKGKEVVGDAADAVGDAAGAVGDTAGKAVDKGKEVVGDAAEAVGDAAGAAVDKGKEVVGDAADAVGDAASAVTGKVGDAFDSVGGALDGDGDGSILKWLLPLLLVGLLLLLGFWFCRGNQGTGTTGNSNGTNGNANTNAAGTSTGTSDGAADTVADAARKLTEVPLPDGTKLQAYPGGIEDQLIKYIQSDEYKNATSEELKEKWFDFDDLNFKFGTTELEAASKRQLDNVVAILKAFPEVKFKVGGYTDKKGDDANNKKLSDSRAKAVKAALEKAGVGAQVPEAEGYGEEFAKVAEDASDEERASDRKTSIRLIK